MILLFIGISLMGVGRVGDPSLTATFVQVVCMGTDTV